MISLADFVNVSSGGLLDGVETSSQPAGRDRRVDANTTSAVRPPGLLVSVSRLLCPPTAEYELSVVKMTPAGRGAACGGSESGRRRRFMTRLRSADGLKTPGSRLIETSSSERSAARARTPRLPLHVE